jgi:hypothetical protein
MTTTRTAPADESDVHDQVERQQLRIAELERRFDALYQVVIPIGVALLHSRDFHELLEAILMRAMDLCHADGGTLYLRGEDDKLRFVLLRNLSLGLSLGTSGAEVHFAPLPLYDPITDEPNHGNVATHVALTGTTVNIADAYRTDGFEFSGTIAWDSQSGYRSTSFLTLPLANSEKRVIGVLQLINATDLATGKTVPFDPGVEPIVQSLSTLAAAALEVYAREEGLRRQIRELNVRIDDSRREREVAAITETDYFQELQRKARQLRQRTP